MFLNRSLRIAVILAAVAISGLQESAHAAPEVSATDRATLQTDLNANGKVTRGDTVRHTITIRNTGDAAATGTGYSETLDGYTTLVPGSFRSTPVGLDDSYSVDEDHVLTTPAPGVLANDFDPDGDTLSAIQVTAPSHGALVLNLNGSFSYTPDADYFGSDSFTYKVNDGTADSAEPVLVNITVNPVNDVPSFTKGTNQTINEDAGAQTVTNWGTAISKGPANESGQNLTFMVTNDNNGLFSSQPAIGATGTLTYTTAANANGSATVTVVLSDDGGTARSGIDTAASQSFTITVNPVNDPPVAQDKSYTAQANMKIHLTGLLSGVTDPDSGDAGFTPVFRVNNIDTSSCSGCVVSNIDVVNGTFDFEPPPGVTGTITLTYQVEDNGRPGIAVSAAKNISITVNGPVIWFVDTTSGSDTTGNGTLARPYKTLAKVDTVDAASHRIFLYSGTYSGGITLNPSEWLIGQGVSGASFDSLMGIAPPAGTIARPAIAGGVPVIQGTVAMTSASNALLRGVAISATGVTGFSASSSASITVAETSVTSTGTAVNIASSSAHATNGVTFTSTTSSGGTNGIILADVTGTFAFGSGALTGHSTASFALTNSSANGPVISYSGDLNPATGGRPVSIGSATASSGMRGGAITLSGRIGNTSAATNGILVRNSTAGTLTFSGSAHTFSTGTNNGVELTTNPGATISFTGGALTVAATSGYGLNATGGGTISVTGANNTITTTTGTALNFQNTTIGASGLTFKSISAGTSGNPANGIVLVSTGSSGGLTVTGDGTNTSVGGNASGGTIQNCSGADGAIAGSGIYLNSTSNVVLRRMTITGTNQNFGIRGLNVNNFTFEYATVSGTNGTATTLASPENYGEGSVFFGNATTNGLTGTAVFTNCSISGGSARNVSIVNGGVASAATLTVKGSTFGAMQNFSAGNQSFAVEPRTSGSTFNVVFGGTNAGEGNTLNNSVSDLANFTGQTGTTMDVQFKNNTLSNNNANNIIGGGSLVLASQGVMTFNVLNNTMRDANGSAITLFKATAGTSLSGTISNNTIGVAGVTDSGSKTGNGIFVSAGGAGTMGFTITNNQIHQIHGNTHIWADNTGGSYTANFTITGNTLDTPGAGWFAGIAITDGSPSSGDTVNVCANIKTNTLNLGGNLGVIVGASGSGSGHTFNLPGYAGGANLTNVQNFIQGNNSGSFVTSAYNDSPATAAAFTGSGTSCPTP